jgi:hypothetical protein
MPRTTAKFLNTDSYELEIAITMELRHWKQLLEQLGESWPAWDLSRHIRDAVNKAEGLVYIAPTE